MLFASISAPTKTQWVLGSNPSRITQQIIKSILKKRLLFLYVPRPKRNGTRVRTPAESLNYLKASSFLRMLFFVCAPTKTQWVLGSNPSRITVKRSHKGTRSGDLAGSQYRAKREYPGTKSRDYQARRDRCLEDSTSPRPKHPRQSAFYVNIQIF